MVKIVELGENDTPQGDLTDKVHLEHCCPDDGFFRRVILDICSQFQQIPLV